MIEWRLVVVWNIQVNASDATVEVHQALRSSETSTAPAQLASWMALAQHPAFAVPTLNGLRHCARQKRMQVSKAGSTRTLAVHPKASTGGRACCTHVSEQVILPQLHVERQEPCVLHEVASQCRWGKVAGKRVQACSHGRGKRGASRGGMVPAEARDQAAALVPMTPP
jgi:hypothetical protein